MIHNDLSLLIPALETKVRDALLEMRDDPALSALGVTGIGVSETLREVAVQMAYYSRGRMHRPDVQAMYKAAGLYAIRDGDTQKTITWTLDSKHLHGEAVDLVPQRSGEVWWNAPLEVWTRMGEIGMDHGLVWGGTWKNKDCPHFE